MTLFFLSRIASFRRAHGPSFVTPLTALFIALPVAFAATFAVAACLRLGRWYITVSRWTSARRRRKTRLIAANVWVISSLFGLWSVVQYPTTRREQRRRRHLARPCVRGSSCCWRCCF